jgi:membrane-associated protein
MSGITHSLLNQSGTIVYVIVAALVFSEAALFVGFVLPGETAVVIGGVLASLGKVSLTGILITVLVSAVVGDTVGYEIGRRYGTRLLGIRILDKHRSKIEKAQKILRERGAFAVFLGRFTAVLRALMPALAGSAKMRYPRFLLFNALGGVIWGIAFTLIGYFAGKSYDRVAGDVGTGMAILIAVVVVAVVGIWAFRRHRKETAPEEPVSEETPSLP